MLSKFCCFKLSHIKPDVVRNSVYQPVSQLPEHIRIYHFHAHLVQQAVIWIWHDIHCSKFEEFLIGPVVDPQSAQALGHVSYYQQYGFLLASHFGYPSHRFPCQIPDAYRGCHTGYWLRGYQGVLCFSHQSDPELYCRPLCPLVYWSFLFVTPDR